MNVKDDLNLGASRVNRNYAPHDQNLVAKTGGTTDASLCLRLNDRLDDLSLDASRANRNCVRRDQMKDVNLDANHVNRNCDPHDLKMDENSDVMSRLLMYY
jgi:hypothetical protein